MTQPSYEFDAASWLQAWQQGLSQSHQQFGALMRSALEIAPLDARGKAQMDFALRQVIDAMNPANSLATNPEAIQAALDSGGTSLVEGARLFLADVAKGRVSMSDDEAFEVGRNVATSPGSVVFENALMQLVQYTPSTAKVHRRPLVIVPPCINKFYILDLQPANSLVASSTWRSTKSHCALPRGSTGAASTAPRIHVANCRWPSATCSNQPKGSALCGSFIVAPFQCSLTCGSVRRVIRRASVSSATFR